MLKISPQRCLKKKRKKMNLDLTSYTRTDLEKLFKLSTPYTSSDIIEKESVIRAQLLSAEDMQPVLKVQLTDFLTSAKEKLTVEPILLKQMNASIPAYLEPMVQGTVNPYQRRIMIKNVNIDTIFRPNYITTTSTDFHISLPESLRNVVSMKLTSMEFPLMHNQYSASLQSSQFTFTANLATGSITKVLYIPDGSYQSDVFENMMNNVFISQGFPYMILEVRKQGQVRIRARLATEGVSVFTAGTYFSPAFTFNIDFSVDSVRPSGTAGWNMGFRSPTYLSSSILDYETGITYKSQIIGESMFGSCIENYIFIEVDDFHNNFQTDTLQSSVGTSYIGNNLLARVAINSGSLTTMQLAPSDAVFRKREYFGPVRLERLHIRVLNRYGEVIDLNGNDLSFVLEFEIVYS